MLSEIRTKNEEKWLELASIMKKKLKNKAKRQEKMSFGVKKGKRKFNPKFKKRPHMKWSDLLINISFLIHIVWFGPGLLRVYLIMSF